MFFCPWLLFLVAIPITPNLISLHSTNKEKATNKQLNVHLSI